MSDAKKFNLSLDHLGAIGSVDKLSSTQVGNALYSLDRACDIAKRGLLAEESTVASAMRLLQQDALGSVVAEFKGVDGLKKLMDPYADIRETLKQQDSLVGCAARFRPELDAANAILKQTTLLQDVRMQAADLFRIPLASEAAEILKALQSGTVAAYVKQLTDIDTTQAAVLASMTSPWMRDLGAQRSASAMLELHGLGNALRLVQGFDRDLTVALRADFGDWRDTIAFPQVVLKSQ